MSYQTNYDEPAENLDILMDALRNRCRITLSNFGYDANLGGNTLVFDIEKDGEESSLEIGIYYLDPDNDVEPDDWDGEH